MNKLTIIILNWNGEKLLKEFLPSVVANTKGDGIEIAVADNGSTDGSLDLLKSEFPEVRVLPFKSNYGFAGGYNRAVRMVDSEYVTLLNSDVETPEGWWQPILDFMEKNTDVGACQPKILQYKNKSMFEYAGAAGGMLDRLGYPYCRGRLFDSVEKDECQYDSAPADVAWASGAALTVRKKAWVETGGLDEMFFAHMEEIDLCLRMLNAGWRVCVVPESKVYHLGGASLPQGDPQKTYLNFRNNLLLLHKNLPRKQGKKVLLRRRLTDTLAFLRYVAKFDFRNARAVMKAHSHFRRMRGIYTRFPERDILSTLPGADRNIVIDRYVKGRKV